MIDWTALAGASLDETPQKAPNIALLPFKSGNKGSDPEKVATLQTIEQKDILGFVAIDASVPSVFEEVRDSTLHITPSLPPSLTLEAPGGVVCEGHSAPSKTGVRNACKRCIHLSRPGRSDGYCAKREDLPPAYGPGHPLRRLPGDGGASCVLFERPGAPN